MTKYEYDRLQSGLSVLHDRSRNSKYKDGILSAKSLLHNFYQQQERERNGRDKESEPKPCPWCGERAWLENSGAVYRVCCKNTYCYVQPKTRWEINIPTVLFVWNNMKGAESVVRGYWRSTTDGKIICSRCGEYPYKGRHGDTAVNYISKKFRPYRCPNCGAKMDEEEE